MDSESSGKVIETIFSTFVKLMYPHIVSQWLDICAEIQETQDPPYSRGILFVEILRGYRHRKWINLLILRDVSFMAFNQMIRHDFFWVD